MTDAALVLCFLLLPAAVLWLVQHQAWARRIGTIVLCYAAGLLIGNVGLLPAAAAPVQKLVSEASIALALPLILFTVDMRAWSRIAGKALLSMALAVFSVLVVATALFFGYRAFGTPAAYELAGLTVGVYTGGTPNLAAIKTALDVADARYLLFNAFDTVVGALYVLFMVSAAGPLARRWLGSAAPRPGDLASDVLAGASVYGEDYAALLNRRGLWQVLQSLAVAALVVGFAVGLGEALGGATALVVALLATLGLLASLWPAVRRLPASYRAGMYLIYAFSFTVASMARLDAVSFSDMGLFAFVGFAVVASLLLHALLCRVAGVDADTFLVTSVSAICSPAFVPMLARQVRDRSVLASGIATGVIGFAIGTQLGIGVALLLKQLG
jgi:uncharacterized membrane protein